MNKIPYIILTLLMLAFMPAMAQIDGGDDIPLGLQETNEVDELDKYFIIDEEASMADKDPYTSDETFAERIFEMAGPNNPDFIFNEHVKSYIERYTKKMRGSVSKYLAKYNLYGKIFSDALYRSGLKPGEPEMLKYLPIIESGLKPRAKSPVGAGGLWQFMPGTAKSYGLVVDSWMDERADPYKGSDAAGKLLKKLYEKFGSWSLALAAYNCGPGNVSKAIARNGGEKDFWKIYPSLPKETRGYVPAFIAACYIMNYYKDHNIKVAQVATQTEYDSVAVRYDLKMENIASALGLNVEEMRDLNPQYNTTSIPGSRRKCSILLPSDKAIEYASIEHEIVGNKYRRNNNVNQTADNSLAMNETTPESDEFAIVDDGVINTASTAQRNVPSGNVTEVEVDEPSTTMTKSVATQNPITITPVNQTTTRNYGSRRRAATTQTSTPTPAPAPAKTTTPVKQTPAPAATPKQQPATKQQPAQKEQPAKTNTRNNSKQNNYAEDAKKKEEQRKAEQKRQEQKKAEQKKLEQKKAEEAKKKEEQRKAEEARKKAEQAKPKTHTVQSGESLEKIAKKNGTTVSELRKANPNVKGDMIKPDQKLNIPKAKPQTQTKKAEPEKKAATPAKNTSSSKNTSTSKKKK